MTILNEPAYLISRREAIRRVSALLGGVALVGGTAMFTGCRDTPRVNTAAFTPFTPDDIAYLDEIAETILPETKTPGAKAARTGAFMALMVTDSYGADDQKIFRAGMRALDDASRKANNVSFVAATPAQRLVLLESLDKEQKTHSDARDAEKRKAKSDAYLPDQRKENASTTTDVSAAASITKDTPAHYFRMMKELALLGYFSSEIGMTKAQQYVESPGRYEPCIPYTPGDRAWAGHA
ncbi:MAG: hypothetical protein JWM95_5259 [Gemmatimonadetes bacterium]|nr:hypothetical protein [Gemmatimonadota bacterium]